MEEIHGHANGSHLNKVFPPHDFQEDFEVDIVAVHGLDTSSPKTWLAYEKDGPAEVRGRAFNWLCDDDMLPAVVPKARIWTFDYNANYHSNASVVDLLALGEMLLRNLSEVRTKAQVLSKPLIFIGSCFGGLVVVKALESAGSFRSEFADILQATTGVVFLGAPLRGTRAANSAQWRILLAGIRGHEVSDTLLTDLNQNSTALRNLVQGFSTMAVKRELRLSITCFYETRKTEVLNSVLPRSLTQFLPKFTQEILVGQESACIDGHDQIPLNVRHAMMNKYRGPKDQNFLLVSSRIKSYVLESQSILASRTYYQSIQAQKDNAWQPATKEVECHQTLRTSDYESHKERNPDRVDGTCRWFLDHPHFKYWWETKRSSLLWVSADPGCGKSVLTKSLIDRELVSTKTHKTCYFFFKDDSVEQRSATNALCALLHQLFDQRKTLVKHAMSDFRSNGLHLPGLFERLWNILKDAAADPEAGTVICIIDGLDECEESGRTRLLKYLDHFYNDTTSDERKVMTLKFLITSRPYFYIERNLKDLLSKYPVIRLAGEEETEMISREIDLVIRVEVQKLSHVLELDDSIRSLLEGELMKFKNRTYLWLHLILEVVRGRLEAVSTRQIREILNSVPESVDRAYSAILERSENTKRAKKLLQIIVSAIRPMTLQEINTAMAIKEFSTSYNDLDIVPEEQWKVILRNLCGLFVTIIDSRIYLIHQTAREFLLLNHNSGRATEIQNCTENWKHSLILSESNLVLARICIWYLLFSEFELEHIKLPQNSHRDVIRSAAPVKKDILEFTGKYPFLSYAAENWAFHFREACDYSDIVLLEFVSLKICNTQSLRFSNWFPVYWTMLKPRESFYPYEMDNLMVASHLGLVAVVQLLLQYGLTVNSPVHTDRTALSWAAEAGHVAVVELLLEKCTTSVITKYVGRSVWRAKATEYKIKIKSLIKPGVGNGMKNESFRAASPTAKALSNQTQRMRFSEQRIDINSADCQGRTALFLSAKNGHKRVVEILLEHNAKIDCEDCFSDTAAEIAANHGHEDVIVFLLERTSWIKSNNRSFGPLLVSAALNGQEAVVKLLLDRGVDIEFKDNRFEKTVGQTALSHAAGSGQSHIVKLLLDRQADIETRDRGGLTPLMHAVAKNQGSSVAVLLQHNANVEAKNKAGETAMSRALVIHEDDSVTIMWGVFGPLLEHGATMRSNHRVDVIVLLDAARRGEISVLRFLLERKGLSIESKGIIRRANDLTPLHQAAMSGQKGMVEFLLERNANIEAVDGERNTPLLWAASARRVAVVDVLLEHQANIESRNNEDKTPLLKALTVLHHPAVNSHELEVTVKTLLKNGANAEATDNDNMTPLLWAVQNEYAGAVEQLLEHGVNTDCKDRNGRTSLQLAQYIGDKKIITLLLRHHGGISSEQDWSRTSLSQAAEKGHDTVVKQYLEEEHDIEAKDNVFGQSPLLWAAENGHEAVVKSLLQHNPQIESKNNFGQTALWLAVRYGHGLVAKLLVEQNAIVHMEDNASRTPIQIANYYHHTGIAVLLENHLKFGKDKALSRQFQQELAREYRGFNAPKLSNPAGSSFPARKTSRQRGSERTDALRPG